MALSHKQLCGFIKNLPNDPLAAMLRETSLNTSFDFPAAQSRCSNPLPEAIPLPMLCELFTDCFADFTLPAKTDSLDSAFAAEWPTDGPRLLTERELYS